MVNPMVERATSSMLIGPDWAMNIEICDTLNRDPSQSKAVVKGIKKRLGSKNPKVKILALTLLETIVKNCGDIVHMHVAENGVLHDMVKIAKKKSDLQVKEKTLILIDTWQEAFGGPRARYPPFYAAYQELLRAGAVFPQRTESSAPVFTPPQTQPLTSYPQNIRTQENRQEAAESSAEAEFPTLSLSEIQNARGIMDVLAEMLNAIDPGNKEGLRQEVIVDLVEQCRTYKQRVVQLVNSTSDEALLSQGLALNDDLQRLLAKHETIASGSSTRTEKSKPQPVQPLVNVDAPLIDAGDSKQANGGSTSESNAGVKLLLPAPANGPSTTSAKVDPKIDLLSGDDFNSPLVENTLAVVPVGQPQSSSPVSNQQNALALVDMFSPNDDKHPVSLIGQYPSTAQQQQQNLQPEKNMVQPNGFDSNTLAPQYQQSSYLQSVNPTWNRQMSHLHQPAPLTYGPQSTSLPAPPWEDQPTANSQLEGNQYNHPVQNGMPQIPQSMGNDQVVGMYTNQPLGLHPQAMQGGQPMGVYPPQMQSGQMVFMYPHQMHSNQMTGYGYGYSQQQNAQFIDQRMSGLSVRDDSVLKNSSYHLSTPSYVPSGKPSKPEDKLFGDLVDITKFKPTKTNGSAGGV